MPPGGAACGPERSAAQRIVAGSMPNLAGGFAAPYAAGEPSVFSSFSSQMSTYSVGSQFGSTPPRHGAKRCTRRAKPAES